MPSTSGAAGTLAGLGYGAVLWIWAIGCTGAGHGTYAPLAMIGAPVSLLGGSTFFFAAPAWWGVTGLAVGLRSRLALIVLGAHCVGVAVSLASGWPLDALHDGWQDFGRTIAAMPFWVVPGLALYAIGLVVAWLMALRMLNGSDVRP